ncbi:unnamed protein product [Paramecium octaurelia]|uniref:Adenylate cyclase n=1 Tax=Paramecium octaurelia TaxID=43137 RepID=A0A8S1TVT1_PAROT|nr:unnamed protein product [Paramecium octaurelia]
MSILGYVPALVVQHLLNLKMNKLIRKLPEKQRIRSVVMFADISGFTRLTELLSQLGTEGAERIAFAINRYMELLVQGIGRSGGDIFKFAGDAMIVIWPPPPNDQNFQQNLETLLKQAIQSALLIQEKLTKAQIEQGIQLSVKIGFGVGEMNIIHVGGVFNRMEYLATGDPLIQAFHSEHCLTEGGKIIISQQIYDMINNFFECQKVADHEGHYEVIKLQQAKVKMKADALLIKNNITLSQFQMIRNEIQSYIPAALLPYIDINEEAWSAELRRLSIMFVNLKMDLNSAKNAQGLEQIQRVIKTVQKCIYMHEGSLNKLLMDDKGSTLIVVFGLPPLSHQNDPVRAILTAQLMNKELPKINCGCSIGIVTGTVFAGVVGTSGSRREYSVLGDSVNLAARLMQAACSETTHKILICMETAKSAGHCISTAFLRQTQVKGKNAPVHIYVPLDKPLEPTPGNLFPNFKTHNYAYGFAKKSDFIAIQLFGREEQHKKLLNQIDKVIKGVDKKSLIILKGTYGCGKSSLAKKVLYRIQEKINSNQYSPWKYGEYPHILVQQLDPITRTFKLNGLRSILKQIFLLYAKRVERPPNMELFNMMVDVNIHPQNLVQMLQEIVGLNDNRHLEKFPQRQQEEEKEVDVKRIIFQFLSNFFEQIPSKMSELYEGRAPDQIGWDVMKTSVQRQINYSIKYTNIIAPVVLCLDDIQNYDQVSFKILKQMIKTYDRLTILALYRDSFQEMIIQPKVAEKRKSQEDIAIEGITALEDRMDGNPFILMQLRGVERKGGVDDEFAKMIRFSFNIQKFMPEQEYHQNISESGIRKRISSSIHDVILQENQSKEINNQFLFSENKQILIKTDVELLFMQWIYMKTSGNPLMVLNFVQNLIDLDLIRLSPKYATITNELVNLITYEESIIVDAPYCRIEVNGPIIDKLSCLEQLLLKSASVIGDIFDIQLLNKIYPFKNAVNNKLQKYLDELESKEVIEVMEVREQNIFYRFTCPFMRDCLYQRITFKQRRQLHKAVAEAIQQLPLPFETEELMECKKLQFQWLMAESNVSQQINFDNNDDNKSNSKPNFLINLIYPKCSQDTQKFKNMSSKALKSIILKQIGNKFNKSQNQTNIILREGVLIKKSQNRVSQVSRYVILDGKELRLYSSRQDSHNSELPLCSIPLKSIYSVLALENEKNFTLQICSTYWYKKLKEMGDRKFLFDAKDNEDLQLWTIYLEFAKALAIYEDFTNNYGKICFPLSNQYEYYDSQFKYDIKIENNKSIRGIQIEKTQKNNKESIIYRNSRNSNRQSKFTVSSKQFKFMEKNQTDELQIQNSQVVDMQLLKERVNLFLQKSILLLFSHLFEQSIQKADDFKILGNTSIAMRKLNNVFKIDKTLINEQNKKSSAFLQQQQIIIEDKQELKQQDSQETKQQDNWELVIQKVEMDNDLTNNQIKNFMLEEKIERTDMIFELERKNSQEKLQDYENNDFIPKIDQQLKSIKDIKPNMEEEDIYNFQLDESAMRKQQHLRIQRLQNFKCSFGNDSFQKMHSESVLRSSPLMKQEDTLTEVLATQSQTENSKRESTDIYQSSQQPPQLLTKISEKESITDVSCQVSRHLSTCQVDKLIPVSNNQRSRQTSNINNQQNKSPAQTQKSLTPTNKSQKNAQFNLFDDCKSKAKRDSQISSQMNSARNKPAHLQTNYINSQKILPKEIKSNPFVYGTAINNCKPITGDNFMLKPGYKVIVQRVDKKTQLIECSYENLIGIFRLRDIAVIEDPAIEQKIEITQPKQPSKSPLKKQALTTRPKMLLTPTKQN